MIKSLGDFIGEIMNNKFSSTTDIDGGNIRYYGSNHNNYIYILIVLIIVIKIQKHVNYGE